jgi:hypothetical protein
MAQFVRARPKSTLKRRRTTAVFSRDATGHIDPRHEDRLRQIAELNHNTDRDPVSSHSFVSGNRTREQLGEGLAEAFLLAATSGDDRELEHLDRITMTEELEPYVIALAQDDLVADIDDSAIPRT